MSDGREQAGLCLLEDLLVAANATGDLSCLTDDFLRRMGEAFRLQRISLFEVREAEGSGVSVTCRVDWTPPGSGLPSMLDGTHPPLTPCGGDPTLAEWAERRRRGEVVMGLTADLSGYARDFFRHYGIVNYLTEPVMVHGRWCGHFCVDTPDASHVWTPEERRTVRSVASVLGGLLARSATEALVSEAGRRAMVDSSIDAVVIADETGSIVEFNRAAEITFGYARADVIGRSLTQTIVPSQHVERHLQGFTRHLATGESRILRKLVEMEGRRADGSTFPVELTVNENRAGGRRLFSAFIRDISERMEGRRALERLAYYDETTGLRNRAGLLRDCAGIAAPASGAVVVLLRELGVVSASFGDDWAGPMIIETAKLLEGLLPEGARLGRIGESEFAILTARPDGARELAGVLVGRLRSAVESSGRRFYIRAGIGFVERQGQPPALLRDAEMAARDCKDGDVLAFADPMRTAHQRNLELEMALRDAIQTRTHELSLHYQPLVGTRTGGLMGFEALVRWNSPVYSNVPPSIFVPLAEAAGFAERLGAWVIENAVATCAAWNARRARRGLPLWRVSINLSATELAAPDLCARVREALERHDLTPKAVCFELTESAILNQPDIAIATLAALRALGCTTAIDDFGTGYSSFSYLQRLPMDVLKIDRSFIFDMMDNSVSRKIVSVMIEMAHALNMSVVAEGVETRAALQTLRQMGCDYAQGFVFSQPMAADAVAGLPEALAPTG